jgi:hypothetical protein
MRIGVTPPVAVADTLTVCLHVEVLGLVELGTPGLVNHVPLAMLIRAKKSGPSKMSPALTFVTLVIATVTGTRAAFATAGSASITKTAIISARAARRVPRPGGLRLSSMARRHYPSW